MNQIPTHDPLAQADRQYRLLVDGITDYAIYLLSPEGIVTNWNAGAQRFKGYRADEIIGSHFSRFYTAEDRATGLPDRALRTAAGEGKFEAEGWRVRKDGSRFWAHVLIDPVYDEQGRELIGFAKITRDMTDRLRVQEELETAREALLQSQKLEAIGQLTGGIAHDFNNLLTAIQGSLELLGKRLSHDPIGQKLLANAVRGTERGATLIERMLSFARRQDLNTVRVDIPAIVQGMADLLEQSIGAEWTIETQFSADAPAVHADWNQLEMALLNLVVNARDAMPQGGTITIRTCQHQIGDNDPDLLAAGRYVSLVVTDSGTGMNADTLAHAMEPFFTTKGVGKGTGLGLSMIHGFAKQAGGKLALDSQPGIGTTAAIWLPVAVGAPPDQGGMAPLVEPGESGPLTILAVDDDALILMNTVAMLEDMGHSVLEAYCGAEALTTIRATPGIDLIITDYAMPGMTGAELIDTVAAEFPGIPMVLATGYGELPCEPRSAVRRLGKPFRQQDLKRAVEAATLG